MDGILQPANKDVLHMQPNQSCRKMAVAWALSISGFVLAQISMAQEIEPPWHKVVQASMNEPASCLRFAKIDLAELEKMTVPQFKNVIVAELASTGQSPLNHESGQSRRHEKLFKIKQLLEQASQFSAMEQDHCSTSKNLADPKSIDSAKPEDLELRQDVARQRWSIVGDRIRLLQSREEKALSNERILNDFVQDDESLDNYLLAKAELLTHSAELKMLQAELAAIVASLDILPDAIKRLQQRDGLSSPKVPDEKMQYVETNHEPDATHLEGMKTSPSVAEPSKALTAVEIDAQIAKIDSRREAIEKELTKLQRQTKALEEKTNSLREKFDVIGLTEGNQLILLEAHRTLPAETEYLIQNFEMQKELKEVNLAMLLAEEHRDKERQLSEESPTGESIPTSTEKLVEAFHQLHAKMIQVTDERDKLISATQSLRYFLDNKLLWVQNSDAVGVNDIAKGAEGLWRLAQPGPWWNLVCGLGQRMARRPFEILFLVGGFIFLRWTSRKLSSTAGSLGASDA